MRGSNKMPAMETASCLLEHRVLHCQPRSLTNMTVYTLKLPFQMDSLASDAISNNELVPNTLPSTPTVSLTPSNTNTYSGADLTCAVTGPSTDIDGDTVRYHYEWYNPGGGLESDTYTSTSTTDVYLGNNVDKVGTWTCRVTPDDDGAGASATDTTTVLGLESCLDYNNAGITIDGVYTLYIGGVEIEAYCDMNTDGGGWTLFAVTGSANCAKT